jgi:hypothetical protein
VDDIDDGGVTCGGGAGRGGGCGGRGGGGGRETGANTQDRQQSLRIAAKRTGIAANERRLDDRVAVNND